MSEWKEFQVNEVANVIMGQSPSSASYNEEGSGIPFLQGCADFGERIPSKQFFCTDPKKIAPKGALLMSVRAPVGTTNKADSDYCVGRGLAGIVSQTADQIFLDYKIVSQVRDLERVSQGSTFLAINTSDLKNLIIKIPTSLPEQRKIARILSTVDAVIEKTEAAIAKYKAIKSGMMRDLFTRGIDLATGKLRPSYEEAPDLYKETELGWVPKEWEVKPLGKYLRFISYGFTNPMPETESGPYMITAANIFDGAIQLHTARKTSNSDYELLTAKSKPVIGDVLITKDGTLGRLAIVKHDSICINQSVAVMRFEEQYDPLFFKLLLETSFYQDRIIFDAGGSTIKHIYITKLDKMLIGSPKEIDELNAISRISESTNNIIKMELEYLEKNRQLKSALMSDLLTGKVRVKYDEEKGEVV